MQVPLLFGKYAALPPAGLRAFASAAPAAWNAFASVLPYRVCLSVYWGFFKITPLPGLCSMKGTQEVLAGE